MGYYIDLSAISIDSYEAKLKSSYLLPSRTILKERLDERFRYFRNLGIKTTGELQQALKDKNKMARLSEVDYFSGDYLTVLLRELNSYHPKPNKIKDFPGISDDVVSKLEKIGIKDTLALFDKIKTKKSRETLAIETGIDREDLLELTKLTDLSRIRWVGVMFARILYESGFDTLESVAKADPTDLYKKITQTNKEKKLYKGQIGLNDMNLCVTVAKEVPLEIEY